MKKKLYLFIGFFTIFLSGYAQFKSPEVTLKSPKIIFPEEAVDYSKLAGKILKKKTIITKESNGTLRNETNVAFDKNGNITNETKLESPYLYTFIYTYKKNNLIEKKTAVTSDVEFIKRFNQDSEQRSQTSNRNDEVTMSVIYDERNETELYQAVFDNNNLITSYRTENYSKNNATNELKKSVSEYTITYDQNRISKIKSDSGVNRYFYKNDLLVKKTFESVTPKYQRTVDEDYSYDKNNNLIVVKINSLFRSGDKILEKINKVRDSAVYNNTNKIIWLRNEEYIKTFKYNSDNLITEISTFYKTTPVSKQEYFYDNSLLTKSISTDFGRKYIVTKIYKYNNGILKEYETIDYYTNQDFRSIFKSIYEYNEKNQIKKITLLKKFLPKEGVEMNFTVENETSFNYTQNSIIITQKNGSLEKYEFY